MSAAGTVPLTSRIVIALDQLRAARASGHVSREWAWQTMFDNLLDQYAKGRR